LGSYLFTSESVSEGHPDKVADQISDAVLDAYLEVDPHAHVACETLVTTGQVILAGEVKYDPANGIVDPAEIARETVRRIGYDNPAIGFDYRSCGVLNALHAQSPDIDQGVDRGEDIGAGDQGMMFGYAVDETDELMPMPIQYAHRLVRRLADARHDRDVDFLGPDAKSQVTVRYTNGHPEAVTAVVVSTQHDAQTSAEKLHAYVQDEIIRRVIPGSLLADDVRIYINPTGRFVVGGPHGDAGLTGRKIIVDTYGGAAHHGGGAFSGKDPTKVDRSAHYVARYAAKNLVAAALASKVEIQLAYAIGVAEPVSVMVNSFGTGRVDDDTLATLVREVVPLTPRAIIDHLALRRPIYAETAAYGHFGREDAGFPWERRDLVEPLRDATASLESQH